MKNLAVFYGGRSVEHDISIITAMQAIANINTKKYNVIPIYLRDKQMFTSNKNEFLKADYYYNWNGNKGKCAALIDGALYVKKMFGYRKYAEIDCALLCCHGGYGENGGLQGLLDIMDIPYTSSDLEASAICMDKALTHDFVTKIGIKSVKYITITDKCDNRINEKTLVSLGGKVVVKPNSLGSSIGVGFADNIEDLKKCVELALTYDKKVIIEECVCNMTELNCGIVMTDKGLITSDIERPITANEVLDFSDKYMATGKMCSMGREFPANISEWLAMGIKEISKKAYRELNLSGVVRIDYMYDRESKELYLNEINTIPGSLAYYLFRNQGIDFALLIDEMINEALKRKKEEKYLIKQYKSSVLTVDRKNGAKMLQKG